MVSQCYIVQHGAINTFCNLLNFCSVPCLTLKQSTREESEISYPQHTFQVLSFIEDIMVFFHIWIFVCCLYLTSGHLFLFWKSPNLNWFHQLSGPSRWYIPLIGSDTFTPDKAWKQIYNWALSDRNQPYQVTVYMYKT